MGAGLPVPRTGGTSCRLALCFLLVLLLPGGHVPKPALASNVWAKVEPRGDRGFHGDYGPPGRSGHTAMVSDESRMFEIRPKVSEARSPSEDMAEPRAWIYFRVAEVLKRPGSDR